MASPFSRAVNRFQRASVALLKIKQKDALAERYEPLIAEYFREFERKFMFRFEVALKDKFPEPKPKMMAAKPKGKKDDEGNFQMLYLADALNDAMFSSGPELQKALQRIEKESLMQGANQMKAQFAGVGAKFDLSNPRAVEYIRKTGGSVKYIKDIQQTTADSITNLVEGALERGWSYQQTASALHKMFDDQFTKRRARLIAVTETAAAYEAGNRAFAKEIEKRGVEMEKMWVTSHDDRVSDECAANEAVGWIPIDDAFPSGDEEPPRFPGCRCYAQYREVE